MTSVHTAGSNLTVVGYTPHGSMDKVRKLLNSPGSKHKSITSNHGRKTFGLSLEELTKRSPPGSFVPFVVKRICEHIKRQGFHHEGIFRVSGSIRVVEKLKYAFDSHGNAPLEEEEDIMAVAGLLKLFLRELPDAVIPMVLTKQFINIQEAYLNDTNTCLYKIKEVLTSLPQENYHLLKYLMGFLVAVSSLEKQNKMSPMALAIVFGPNLFKCGQGIVGLKDQGTVNQIVYKFISYYSMLFKMENEEAPELTWTEKEKTPPPRPPPPKFQVVEAPMRPVPSPRKMKQSKYDSSQYQEVEHDNWDPHSEGSSSHLGRGSPRFSDDELTAGCPSPLILDSDGGYSMIESPIPSARTSETVEKVITETISEQLFGGITDRSLLQETLTLEGSRDIHGADPDSKETSKCNGAVVIMDTQEDVSNNNGIDEAGKSMSIKDRVQQLEVASESHSASGNNSLFGSHNKGGMLITQALKMISGKSSEQGNSSSKEGHTNSAFEMEDDFEMVRRNSDTLPSFKRPAGPPNRRSPTRRSLFSGDQNDLADDLDKLLKESEQAPQDKGIETIPMQPTQSPPKTDDIQMNGDIQKPRVAFLELTNTTEEFRNRQSQESSPYDSPGNSRKPFIPPLDFTTLHHHVESSDAIPAQTSQSVVYQKIRSQLIGDEVHDTQAIVSPRSNKHIKRKAEENHFEPCFNDTEFEAPLSPSAYQTGYCSMSPNTDVAPSPPGWQDQYKKHSMGSSEDEYTSKLRQYTKKIHGLKKKIRQFEDKFEKENGYKPSHSDKLERTEVKKWMNDIMKCKRDIRKLKEEAEMGSRSRHGSGTSSSGERGEPPDLPPTMEHTLRIILEKLQVKRQEVKRPQNMEEMTRDQIQDEKLSIQKSLLHFESIHGRPKTKEEKDLMRPLYDRYRSIKRMLAKPTSPREKQELQTVPEDQAIELEEPSKFRKPLEVQIPTADVIEEEKHPAADGLATMEFAVTRDFSIFTDTVRAGGVQKYANQSPKTKHKEEGAGDAEEGEEEEEEDKMNMEASLHEMSMPELQDALLKSRNEKKCLRRLLRQFEDEFFEKYSRKVQREDRLPFQTEYQDYKKVKARLKLLEVLITKHHHASAIEDM